jgi:palmitoyltransferase
MKRRPAAASAAAAAAEKAVTPAAPPRKTSPLLDAPRRFLASLYARLPKRFSLNMDNADLVIRALEPVAVFLCIALIASAVIFYSRFVTPEIFARLGPAAGLLHTTFGLSLCYAFGRSYYHLLTTPPGTTKDIGAARLEELRKKTAAERGDATPCWRFCDRCALPKPPLSHHCSVCGSCVLRADHHCPWFANCLGFGNYRHFVLFLAYLSAAAAYACATTYFLFSAEAVRDPWSYRWLIVLALAAGGLGLALAALLGWHFLCLSTGMGTLEMMDRVLGWHEQDDGGEEERESEEDENTGGGEGDRRRQRRPPPPHEDDGEDESEDDDQAEDKAGGGEGGKRRRQKRAPPPPHVALKSLRDYPWNLGLEGNVRLAFDLQDGKRWWWVRWLQVHGAPRRGDGVVFPVQQRASAAMGGGGEAKKKKAS